MYRLMIKTHSVTGLKYLCITNRENWEKYTGSGVYWKKHLKQYGHDFTTEVIFENEDYDVFLEKCLFFSSFYDVADSKEWANLIHESGYGDNSEGNFVVWWRYASDDLKKEVIERRAASIKLNHWSRRDGREEIIDKIKKNNWHNDERRDDIIERLKIKQDEYWGSLSIEERRASTHNARLAAEEWRNNLSEEENDHYSKLKSEFMKQRSANTPFEVLSERSRQGRLNMSPEKKLERKTKIQAVYSTGKHDAMFERFSKERQGVNNPAAKIIIWEGVEFTKKDFKQKMKELSIPKAEYEQKLISGEEGFSKPEDTDPIDYDNVECPHCKKQSCGKKPSAFKRWHFDNCKEKI